MSKIISFFFLNLIACFIYGQNLTLDGYVFESGNRGFLNVVQITVLDEKDLVLGTTFSDLNGHFEISVPARFKYKVQAFKDMFEEMESEVDVNAEGDGDKIFLKLKMKRAAGYMFEITLAEKRDHDSIVVDAIKNARIEVYNNTKKEPVLELVQHPHPHFDVALQKGNHYTVLVRKDGYLGKRMEAFVDVAGCILCFEGIGSVNPGVTDNLSEGNQMGVLLANVELDKIYTGKTIPISNIFYEYGSAEFKKNDEDGLLQLATLMKDNPDLTIEIGSHTDSRGKQERNMELSQERARNVVDFLIEHGVSRSRLIPRGYGETELKNDCNSFTDCTEKQHSINRRTELKVLGIAAVKAPVKSLAQIKQMEQGEALLQDIQFGGQVQVPVDSSQMDGPTVDLSEGVSEDAAEKILENEEDAIIEEKQDSTKEIIKDKIKGKLQANEEIENSTPSSTPVETNSEKSEVKDNNQAESVSTIRIVIKKTEDVLPADSEIFELHSNVSHLKDPDGMHLYMIGEFNDITDAKKFHKTVKFAYSESYIVSISEGKVTML